MKKRIYIALTTLLLLLTADVSGGTLFPFDSSEPFIKVQPASASSPNQPRIIDIYFPVERGIRVSNTISDSVVHDKNEDQGFGGSSQKPEPQNKTSWYFTGSETWIPNSTVRKLLYPFHSFP